MFDIFANITTIYLLYLLYGVAFLFLGVSIISKDMKGSDLKLAGKLRFLAMFGFLHGAHEWLELGPLIEGEHLSFDQIFQIKAASACVVILSFLSLLHFGVSMAYDLDGDRRLRYVRFIYLPLFLLWTVYVWYYGFHQEGFHIDMQSIRQADIGARFIFGFSGGMLTAYSLVSYSREVRVLSRPVSGNLTSAGITFAFYAVFAGILSTSSTLPILYLPVEFLRGLSAFLITYFISHALNIFDIETRRKIEEQARRLVQSEKLTSLGQLAAGIAHEINNPLASASLVIENLKNKLHAIGDVDGIVEKLGAAERNIDRASAIAQELLQFSRQQETEFIPVDINSVIKGSLTLLQHKLKHISVQENLYPVSLIMGDAGKLEQVFINIIANSIEAMSESGVLALSTSENKDFINVQIEDTGAGIAAENLSRVFDPFFTTKEIGKGTGLGLSICYGIIRLHHGTIAVSSAAGKGTTVSIRLPIRERYEKDTDRR